MKNIKYLILLTLIVASANFPLFAQRPTTNNNAASTPANKPATPPPAKDKKESSTPPKNEPNKPAASKPAPTANQTAPAPNNNNNAQGVTFKNDTIIKLKDSPKIEVVEINEYMSQGQRAGVRVLIPLNSADQVEAAWKQYVKPFKGKTKNAFRDEVFTDNAHIKGLGENPVDMYAKIEDSANGTLLRAFFDLGGVFVGSSANPDKFVVVKNIVREFAALQVSKKIEQKLAKEEEKLLDIATKRQDVDMMIQQLQLDLERMKDDIYKTEQKIKTAQTLKEQKDVETGEQIKIVEQLRKDIKSVSGGSEK